MDQYITSQIGPQVANDKIQKDKAIINMVNSGEGNVFDDSTFSKEALEEKKIEVNKKNNDEI